MSTELMNGNAIEVSNETINGKPILTAREKKLLAGSTEPKTWTNGNCGGSQDEWQAVPSEMLSLKQSISFDFNNSISTPINFTEAWSFFQSCDMSSFKKPFDAIHQSKPIRQRILRLMGMRRLKTTLVPEKDLICAVANCPMNNDYTVHRRILQSIFVFMTKKSSCPRYGTHWEEVGFQGQDPASDLRGVGMLGALQILYLSSAQETKDSLAPDIYELSRHPVHQFPLAVLSLNVTRMALDALRDGLLNKYCNKKNEAVGILNRFYLAIMYRIYKKWKENDLTIHDSCFLLKDVEKWCRTHPRRAFSRLEDYLAQNNVVCTNGFGKMGKKKQNKKNELATDDTAQSLSWLDLTKPSLEVFI